MATREQTLASVAGKPKEADESGGCEAEHLVAETFLVAAPHWPTQYSSWQHSGFSVSWGARVSA